MTEIENKCHDLQPRRKEGNISETFGFVTFDNASRQNLYSETISLN